ncbi:hypothetical protein [Scytonema sp. UIC 10036]|nr:hypothetical protein [Scytonema sp. UIC 10036]
MMKLRFGKEISACERGETAKQHFLGKALPEQGFQIIPYRK